MMDVNNPAGFFLIAIVFCIGWLVTSVIVVITTDYIWDKRKRQNKITSRTLKENLTT
jgi:hypothetical protein